MSCGCGETTSEERKTRAAMCETCVWSIRGQGRGVKSGVVDCGFDKKNPVPFAVCSLLEDFSCPARRFGEEKGVTRWLGVAWYGTPYPIRLWLWAFHERHPSPSSFDGCGCVKRLKDLWTRARSFFDSTRVGRYLRANRQITGK